VGKAKGDVLIEKRQGPMAKKCYSNKYLMMFFGGRVDKDKRRPSWQ
jgi:hypothetical protein